MANREQRANHEKRKPKTDKAKPSVQASPFARAQVASNLKIGPGRKGR